MKDAYIQLLEDCNNDCLFCSVPKRKIYLPYEDILEKIDVFVEQGFDQITLTGGEPTLHKRLIDIIQYVKSKHLSCRIITNGSVMDNDLIDKIISAGIDEFCISVHTFNDEKARLISANKKYDINIVEDRIRYILDKRLNLSINITINKMNYEDLPDMARKIVSDFPRVNVVNFNYIDIWGNVLLKKATENIGIQYYVSEIFFIEAFKILKDNGILFRAERFPLCYLVGFENYSSDYIRVNNIEEPKTVFVDPERKDRTGIDHVRGDACGSCNYSSSCLGISINYSNAYGTRELYPIFHNLNSSQDGKSHIIVSKEKDRT